MKRTKLIFLSLFSLLLFSCSQDDGKISFTILQVNDVYEIDAIQNNQFGGMARVETIRQELLAKDKNTMFMIAGDFLNPSLVGTMKYEGKKISGRQMVEVMNAMDMDLAAFGNHEFDVKESELQERLNESNFPWISANVFHVRQEQKDTVAFHQKRDGVKSEVKGSFIKEITDEDGTSIKVGFISVCIPSNPKSHVYYTDMFEEIQEEYNSIKDQVDVVLGLTHVKISEDMKIAGLLPDIPLIMGGHEHTRKDEKVGNVIIKKADANAKSAFIHTISFDKASQVTSVDSQFKLIDNTIAFDSRVEKIVKKWDSIMKKEITKVIDNPDEVIYHAEEPLEGRDTPIRSEQTNLGIMIAESMSFSYNDEVDCSFTNGGGIRIDDVLEGEVRSIDIFRVLPYGGSVYKVKMKGSLLIEVLNFGENASGTGAYLQREKRITQENGTWMISGKKIQANKTYTVATIDFLLRGLDIPFLTPDNKGIVSIDQPKEEEMAYDVRKGVIEYMKKLDQEK